MKVFVVHREEDIRRPFLGVFLSLKDANDAISHDIEEYEGIYEEIDYSVLESDLVTHFEPIVGSEDPKTMEATIENGVLVVRIPVQTPAQSFTGRVLIVANSEGPKQTTAMFDGKPVTVKLSAWIKP